MEKGTISIGTSGWSYKHWKGLFYPPQVKPAQYLSFYAQHFGSAEINASFYRLPTPETVEKWAATVPHHFTFCAKMSRYLTHMKKLQNPEEPLERFFAVFEPLYSSMGPVLLQLPANVPFNYALVENLFRLLTTTYKRHHFVVEARHQTWFDVDAISLLLKYNIGLVIAQSGNLFPFAEIITSNHIYIRFHGPAQLYASAYSDEMLTGFAEKMKKWASDGHQVWAFFNNDIHGYAITDAARLKELVNA